MITLAERIRLALPSIHARTGNMFFDAGTHEACERIERVIADHEKHEALVAAQEPSA